MISKHSVSVNQHHDAVTGIVLESYHNIWPQKERRQKGISYNILKCLVISKLSVSVNQHHDVVKQVYNWNIFLMSGPSDKIGDISPIIYELVQIL